MKKHITKYTFLFIVVILIAIPYSQLFAKISLPASQFDKPTLLLSNNELLPVQNNNQLNIGSGDTKKEKSKTKAVLLSFLMPGAGQLYLGEKGRGEVFLGVEVLTWVGFAAFRTSGSWKEDDYISFAQRHAGIDPNGKDDDFYKNLSFYDSQDQYNGSGRIINPDGPYYPYTPEYYWQWDSETSKNKFRDIRNSSKSDLRNATFMIGVAIINRLIASIDTFRLTKKMRSRSSDNEHSSIENKKIKFDFSANPFGSNPKINLTLSKRF